MRRTGVMSQRQIEERMIRRKVDPGEYNLQKALNLDGAIAVALQAFEGGLYFVLSMMSSRPSASRAALENLKEDYNLRTWHHWDVGKTVGNLPEVPFVF